MRARKAGKAGKAGSENANLCTSPIAHQYEPSTIIHQPSTIVPYLCSMNIAALVSGGVDSSVTIPILKEQGYDPVVCYIRITLKDDPAFSGCPQDEDLEIVRYLVRKYGCRFEEVDLEKEYRERIIAYLIDSVARGFTPNPDVLCNRLIKFGAFEEKLGKDFDLITTGHYARKEVIDGVHCLKTAADRHKDQTYFLARITEDQLRKISFPIGELLKAEVREWAEREKLPSAHRPDSQGICFLGEINYNDFIKRYIGEKTGRIVELETGRVLGNHKGFWFHTIGQRKGLGLAQGPWFVVKKDPEENVVYVSHGYDPEAQYRSAVLLGDFLSLGKGPFEGDGPWPVSLKIRHTPEFMPAQMRREGALMQLLPESAMSGVAPGQFGVVYDPEMNLCLGSGVIVDG